MTADLDELKEKMKYMYFVDDTLTDPQEIWYHPEDETTYYLKKFENDVTIVAKVMDGKFKDFEVYKKDYDKIDALRCGMLKYTKD